MPKCASCGAYVPLRAGAECPRCGLALGGVAAARGVVGGAVAPASEVVKKAEPAVVVVAPLPVRSFARKSDEELLVKHRVEEVAPATDVTDRSATVPAVVVNDNIEGSYRTGKARCVACRHEWVAVAPLGTVALECPSCGGEDKGRFVRAVVPPGEGGERWVCVCGCDAFYLLRSGPPMCMDCGLRVTSWAEPEG